MDEPAGEREFSTKPKPRRTAKAGSKPCTASQLKGRLDKWWFPKPGAGGAGTDYDGYGKQIGEIDVRNVSGRECTLQGEVDVRLRAEGREVDMGYSHGVDEEGRRRVTVVPPGEHASLRIDWGGSFCDPPRPPFTLSIALPKNGGTLMAPVASDAHPPCSRNIDGPKPTLSSHLAASTFDEPAEETKLDSPLNPVTISISPPNTARAGERITYHVTLRNPTAKPIPLRPCPGYVQQIFVQGTATVPGINEHQTYRLNCRPVGAIPAGGSIQFTMVVTVPAALTAGRKLDVLWFLVAPRYMANRPGQRVEFTVPIS